MPNKPQSSVFSRSYNSFSGVDIKAVFGNKVIAELQAISYSITREKAPIYTMGSADPRSYSRGKRCIAGTLIFIVFDRHSLLGSLGGMSPDGGLKFQSDIDDVRPLPGGGIGAADPEGRGVQAVQNAESDLSSIGSDQVLT